MRTLNEILGPTQFVGSSDMEPRSRPLTSRPGGEIFVVAHHSVSRTLQAILNEFFSPNRTLSATAAVGPLSAGVDAYQSRHCVPWNTHRPYTTSSWIDDQAITFEMANLVLSPPWPVGQTGKNWFAELVAAMHVELGMPIDRWHVTYHNEVYERGWGSYPTACCGEDLASSLDWVCAQARIIVAEGGGGGDDMYDAAAEARLMAALELVKDASRREARWRKFSDVTGRHALGRAGDLIPLSSTPSEALVQMQQISAANPLLLPPGELNGTIPVLTEVAFLRMADAYFPDGTDEYGVFVKNAFELKGGPTTQVRTDLDGNTTTKFNYPSRQNVWADARPVEITYDGIVVEDFVNAGGTYKAVLANGKTVNLTEDEVARANSQRPAGQDWRVNR